jgi:hypothetical protein
MLVGIINKLFFKLEILFILFFKKLKFLAPSRAGKEKCNAFEILVDYVFFSFTFAKCDFQVSGI